MDNEVVFQPRMQTSVGPRPPLVPASSQVFSDQIDWSLAAPFVRSFEGRTTGVYRFDLPDRQLVIKPYANAQAELLSTRLAADAGIRVPRMVLERHNAPYLRNILRVPSSIPVLAMDLVEGQDFTDLSLDNINALAVDSPTFATAMCDLGKVCAVDYFIGNTDRLPLAGLRGFNQGNLMVSNATIVAIDSTLATQSLVRNSQWLGGFRRSYLQAFKVCRFGDELPGEMPVFENVPSFFPSSLNLQWPDMRPHLLDGFRTGTSLLAELNESGLHARIAEAERHLHAINYPVKKFLEANLRAVRRVDLFPQ